jgi:putative phosphoesterase
MVYFLVRIRYNNFMVGILSDSHDNLTAVRRAVQMFKDAGCTLVIHAGDFVAPFAARELAAAGCPIKAVFGNCDGEKTGLKSAVEPFGLVQEAPLTFESEGLRFAVVHLNAAAGPLAAGQKYDVVVFGHTHNPEVRKSGKTLVVNPGETGGWTTGKSTVALFDPKTGRAEIVFL